MGSSLRVKWVLMLVIITTACLTLAGSVNYTLAKEKMRSYIQQQNLTSVQTMSNHLNEWLSVRFAEAGVISRTHLMRIGSLEDKLSYLRQEILYSDSAYHSAGIANTDGNLTLTTGQIVNVLDEANFQAALKGRGHISDPFFGKVVNDYILTIYVPIWNDQGQIACFLNISFDAKKLFEEQLHIEDPSLNGRIALMRDDGTVLYSSNTERILTMNYARDFPEFEPFYRNLLHTGKGYGNIIFQGVPILLIYSKVPNVPWYLLYSIPQQNLDKPLQSLFIFTIFIIAITELVLASLIFIVVNSMIIRRIRELLYVTEAVAGGNLSVAAIETNSRDELGALAVSVNDMAQNLRDLFQPFESFIQNNQYAMIVIDEAYRIVSFNQRAEEMLGYRAEQVISKETPLLWHDQRQLQERANAYAADLGEHIEADCTVLVAKPLRQMAMDQEWIFIRADRTRVTVYLNVSPMTLPDGSTRGFVLLARDISQFVQATETSNRLFHILDAAQDFIASFDLSGNMFYMNAAGKRLLEIDVLDEDARRISNYLEAGTAIQLAEGLAAAQQLGYWENETEFITQKGSSIITSQIIVAHQPSDGGEAFFSTIVRDIRDKKQIQLELVQAKEEADKANFAKSLFLARMSHEIRNPLNGIMGLSYLLKRTELTEIQRDYQEKISISSQTLLQVINDILDFSKIEADKLTLERASFNLDETIRKLGSVLGVLLGHKPIDIIFRMEGDPPLTLIGDPLRLEQILLNLISNAIKFTDSGSITLLTRIVEHRDREIAIRFSVSDTGIGMSHKQMVRLFQPFMQAEESTSRKYGGTGLGLNISKNLIEMMGGTLSVKSETDLGSTFTFTLRFESPEPLHKQTFPLLKTQSDFRIMVVEDSPELAACLTMMLGSFLLPSVTCPSWTDAVYRLGLEWPPVHAVLLDMEADDMHGEESWLQMRQTAEHNGACTIVCTTLAGRDALQQLPDHQMPDTILIKPISRLELYYAVAAIQEKLEGLTNLVPTAAADSSHKNPAAGTALLVEDNAINRMVAKEMLEARGISVTMASHGHDALQLLAQGSFDIILMDIEMPELDGLETTEIIRHSSQYAHIPIIALTADATVEQRKHCLRIGMNDMLTKPLDPDLLATICVKWLPATRFVRRNQETPIEFPGLFQLKGMDTQEALYRMDGKIGILIKMIYLFRDEHQHTIALLQQSIDEDDRVKARRLAHSLQGVAGNLAMKGLFVAALTLEGVLSECTTDDLPAHVAFLKTRLDELLESIQQAELAHIFPTN
jgi:two-component system sensor histidine kinase/response regulator